ncbi:hemolysin family protein [Brachybacterium rhamnosum]|uniref:Hemolysin family protein n=1 Tax=Brachybacterium rhamnosum TaxID=173361 RepID=A0ABW4Q0B9_9MICO
MTADLLTPLALAALAVLGAVVAAVLAAADSAHRSVTRQDVTGVLEEEPDEAAAQVRRQYEDAGRTLASVGIGTVLGETLATGAATAALVLVLEGWVLPLIIGVLGSALVLFCAASVAGRTVGRRRSARVIVSTRHATAAARVLLWPVAGALLRIGATVTPGVAEDPYEAAAAARRGVDRALENEHLRSDERSMIHGVFELGGTMVRELMVPRTDMVTVPADGTAEAAMRLFVRSGFSRVPVVGDDVDDLRGMLYVKDVMRTIHAPRDPRPGRPVSEIMRPARFVPEFVPADEVLRQMQASRVHISIVVDEYGGVSGIVTIEDIVEEIVGEIADEHDRVEPEIEEVEPGTFRVPARAGVGEVGEIFGLDIDDEDVDSVGGLLGKVLGQVPIVGSSGEAHGLRLEAEATSGRRKRLSTLLVSRAPRPGDDHHPSPPEDPDDR